VQVFIAITNISLPLVVRLYPRAELHIIQSHILYKYKKELGYTRYLQAW